MKRVVYISFLSLAIGIGLPFWASSQTFQFKNYGIAEGIHFPFIYTLDQDENGYLLIGTGEGLYRFDGFNFSHFSTKDSLASDFINCSFADSKGNIWYGHNEGAISKYSNTKIKAIDNSAFTNSRINAITEDETGNIWVATQNDGLIRIAQNYEMQIFKDELEGFLLYDIAAIPGNGLLLATDVGLISIDLNTNESEKWNLQFVENSPLTPLCISDFVEGCAYIGTEDEGVFNIIIKKGILTIEQIATEHHLDSNKIVDISTDSNAKIWLSSLGSGVMSLKNEVSGEWKYINYADDEQISKNVKTTLIDREGNLWVGTYGDGLEKLINNQFALYRFADGLLNHEIHSFLEIRDTFWIGTNKHLIQSAGRPGNVIREFNLAHGLPVDTICGIFKDNTQKLWLATSRNGIYYMSKDDTIFKSYSFNTDRLSNLVSAFTGYQNTLYIGTKNGLFELNTSTLESKMYTNRDGLLHNKIRSLYCNNKAELWIGTEGNGVNLLKNRVLSTIQIADGTRMFVVRSITEDRNGFLWIGTEGDGLIKLGENLTSYTTSEGLYSNYCKAIIADKDGRIWVSHTGALSRIDQKSNLVEVFSEKRGMHYRFNDNSSFLDQNGDLWFPGNSGLVRYQASVDVLNQMEPALNITGITISDKFYPATDEIHLPYGVYKLRFDFVGISHRDAERVQYRYLLEGHDLEWSQIQPERYAQYNRLEPGSYVFKVITYNADGIGGTTMRTVRIIIEKPFWQKLWFIAICLIILFLIIRYFVMRRERFLKQNQEYLKRELDARTSEVVLQKELLEDRNNDITASIEYARNIQSSLLPSEEKLRTIFKDAFAYIKAKDIVSGDFFWVEEFDDVVLLACADCTGHGVPGAFMSLIGSALLKQVCHTKSIHSPEMVLQALDKELESFTTQNIEGSGIADGMDIAVIEYNKKTRLLRLASARRPVVIYCKGQRIDVNGDRFSIGGVHFEEKKFILHNFQLSAGDSFYMFSDGLSDQFGGPLGKKLKKRGVVEMLDKLRNADMIIQREMVKQKFESWMGEQAQIDDVILLGIKT